MEQTDKDRIKLKKASRTLNFVAIGQLATLIILLLLAGALTAQDIIDEDSWGPVHYQAERMVHYSYLDPIINRSLFDETEINIYASDALWLICFNGYEYCLPAFEVGWRSPSRRAFNSRDRKWKIKFNFREGYIIISDRVDGQVLLRPRYVIYQLKFRDNAGKRKE